MVKTILAVVITASFLPSSIGATEFEELRTRYFVDRSVDYAEELILKEQYLGALYQNTAAELSALKREGIAPQISTTFWETEPIHFDRDNPEFASLALPGRFQVWVDFEEREYQRRLQKILGLRSSLIEKATDSQRLRMFRCELEQAMVAYGKQQWELADLLFNRLLEDYPYTQMDDILYYQSETNIQLNRAGSAISYLLTLLSQQPESEFRAKSYETASRLMFQLGESRDLLRLYRNYEEDGFPGKPGEMGGVHLRAAQAEVRLGHFEAAVSILERISTKSEHYLTSRYFLSDCLAALEEWPQAVDVLTEMVKMKQSKMPYERWRILTDEARIKLAFIYYQWGELDKATDLFNAVKSNSPFFDRVLMGKAWIAFQLDEYEYAIKNTEELLQVYPRSTEIYEAGSLTGYCYEQMGQKSEAMSYFFDVLDAGVGRSKLQTFMKERARINDALAELESLEDNVFTQGNGDYFDQYKRARILLTLNLRRIRLAELLEANAGMQKLVAERILLDRLISEHHEIADQIETGKKAAMISEFIELENRIYLLMERLKLAGNQRIKSTPLYYHEAQVGFINTMADSLSANLSVEIDELITSVVETGNLYKDALETNQAEKCIEYGLKIDQLKKVLNNSYLNHTLAEQSRRPVLLTRVDRWSDFSFSRYAMGGMEFDELERTYDRMKQVDSYISTLDEMIDRSGTEIESGESENILEDNASDNSDTQNE